MPRSGPRYSEADARRAVAGSLSYSEALRRLGMRPAGGNHATLKKYVAHWGISVDHFDPGFVRRQALARRKITPLEEILVECPNCAATLDTHCGRNLRLIDDRACERCGETFHPGHVDQRHCSKYCGQRHDRSHLRVPRPETRKVPRPSYEQLKADLSHMTWLAVGRKYGVSDNAVRKWMRWYESDAEAA